MRAGCKLQQPRVADGADKGSVGMPKQWWSTIRLPRGLGFLPSTTAKAENTFESVGKNLSDERTLGIYDHRKTIRTSSNKDLN
jgi:hypothetical protein